MREQPGDAAATGRDTPVSVMRATLSFLYHADLISASHALPKFILCHHGLLAEERRSMKQHHAEIRRASAILCRCPTIATNDAREGWRRVFTLTRVRFDRVPHASYARYDIGGFAGRDVTGSLDSTPPSRRYCRRRYQPRLRRRFTLKGQPVASAQ